MLISYIQKGRHLFAHILPYEQRRIHWVPSCPSNKHLTRICLCNVQAVCHAKLMTSCDIQLIPDNKVTTTNLALAETNSGLMQRA